MILRPSPGPQWAAITEPENSSDGESDDDDLLSIPSVTPKKRKSTPHVPESHLKRLKVVLHTDEATRVPASIQPAFNISTGVSKASAGATTSKLDETLTHISHSPRSGHVLSSLLGPSSPIALSQYSSARSRLSKSPPAKSASAPKKGLMRLPRSNLTSLAKTKVVNCKKGEKSRQFSDSDSADLLDESVSWGEGPISKTKFLKSVSSKRKDKDKVNINKALASTVERTRKPYGLSQPLSSFASSTRESKSKASRDSNVHASPSTIQDVIEISSGEDNLPSPPPHNRPLAKARRKSQLIEIIDLCSDEDVSNYVPIASGAQEAAISPQRKEMSFPRRGWPETTHPGCAPTQNHIPIPNLENVAADTTLKLSQTSIPLTDLPVQDVEIDPSATTAIGLQSFPVQIPCHYANDGEYRSQLSAAPHNVTLTTELLVNRVDSFNLTSRLGSYPNIALDQEVDMRSLDVALGINPAPVSIAKKFRSGRIRISPPMRTMRSATPIRHNGPHSLNDRNAVSMSLSEVINHAREKHLAILKPNSNMHTPVQLPQPANSVFIDLSLDDTNNPNSSAGENGAALKTSMNVFPKISRDLGTSKFKMLPIVSASDLSNLARKFSPLTQLTDPQVNVKGKKKAGLSGIHSIRKQPVQPAALPLPLDIARQRSPILLTSASASSASAASSQSPLCLETNFLIPLPYFDQVSAMPMPHPILSSVYSGDFPTTQIISTPLFPSPADPLVSDNLVMRTLLASTSVVEELASGPTASSSTRIYHATSTNADVSSSATFEPAGLPPIGSTDTNFGSRSAESLTFPFSLTSCNYNRTSLPNANKAVTAEHPESLVQMDIPQPGYDSEEQECQDVLEYASDLEMSVGTSHQPADLSAISDDVEENTGVDLFQMIPPAVSRNSSRSSPQRLSRQPSRQSSRSPSMDSGKELVDVSTPEDLRVEDLTLTGGTSFGDLQVLTWRSFRRDLNNFTPKVYLAKDLPHDLQDYINAMDPYFRSLPETRNIFEAVIIENTANDEPDAPPIGIVNNVDGESTPPWEFHYSNQMWHGDGVPLPDVTQLKSCDCRGPCDPKSKICACIRRQLQFTKDFSDDFLYDKRGHLKMPHVQLPIFECNDLCGCSDTCMNRVVQHGRKAQVNIAKTKDKGWGVCAGPKKISKGTFIGIYAGELLTDAESEQRGLVYNKFGRTYLFDVDFYYLKDNNNNWGTKYVIDAYHAGNFTRFLNHSCEPNCMLNPCYINDSNIDKPLLSVFTSRDIEAFEELCFSYSGPVDDDEDSNNRILVTPSPSKAHNEAIYTPCRCGAKRCTTVMFK